MFIQPIKIGGGFEYVLTDCNGKIYGIFKNLTSAQIALHIKKHG